jgi:molybdopterin-guanine dinucleotide biosynthesis protein A
MEIDEVRKFDPELRAFLNVNTPEEFAQAEIMAKEESTKKRE